ncbi:MAG TPA: coenzyme F420-0:L-glutamate ligase [bacterium]|nr:coenzyme F420-0:L-glutamate ligase [bacterium]
MEILAVKTKRLNPPQDDALVALSEALDNFGLKENDVLVITSKIISLHQGRSIPIEQVSDKDELIAKESQAYLPRAMVPHNYAVLTLHHHLIAPSAGIDESNALDNYILLPERVEQVALEWHQFFKERYRLNNLGIIITDSRSNPLRLGVTGIGLAFAGFHPLRDYRGQADLFGRPMKISQTNIVDSLAAAAVFAMGECSEQTPAAIVRGVSDLNFTNEDCQPELWLSPQDDIYQSFYRDFLPGGCAL